jgi:hypothetical protein
MVSLLCRVGKIPRSRLDRRRVACPMSDRPLRLSEENPEGRVRWEEQAAIYNPTRRVSFPVVLLVTGESVYVPDARPARPSHVPERSPLFCCPLPRLPIPLLLLLTTRIVTE